MAQGYASEIHIAGNEYYAIPEEPDTTDAGSMAGVPPVKGSPSGDSATDTPRPSRSSSKGSDKTTGPFLSPKEYYRQISSEKFDLTALMKAYIETLTRLRQAARSSRDLATEQERKAFEELSRRSIIMGVASLAVSSATSFAGIRGAKVQFKAAKKDLDAFQNYVGEIDFQKMKTNPDYAKRTMKKIERKNEDIQDRFKEWQKMQKRFENDREPNPTPHEKSELEARTNYEIGQSEQRENTGIQLNSSIYQIQSTKLGSIMNFGQGLNGTLAQFGEAAKSPINSAQKEAEARRGDASDTFRSIGDNRKSIIEAYNAVISGRDQRGVDASGRF